MAGPQLIGPIPRTTPAGRSLGYTGRRPLPDDLLQEASRRLGVVSLLGAALWTVAVGLGHMVGALSHAHPKGLHLLLPDAIAVGAVLVSLAVFVYSRRKGRDPRFVIDVGLGYMVFTAFALGQMFHSEGMVEPGHS